MTPSDAAPPDRRLHPWSWLFVLLQQLRQFILPIIAAFFFGGDRTELWSLIGVGVLTLAAVLQYLTYRYNVGHDGLTIRSGWLHRQRREIPYARIHNVSVNQTVLHRMFGVAELRLDSAGGDKPEATMRVLRMDDALALERLIRHRGATVDAVGDTAIPTSHVLLSMSLGEVVRLGFISNRGLLVLLGGYAASMQFAPRLAENLVETWAKSMFGWAESHHFGVQEYAIAGATLVIALLAFMRLLSLVLALLQYYGFVLSEDGPRLTVERGLLARSRNSASRRRLQAWTLQEGVLHRLFKRRSLQVDTAGGQTREGQAPRAFRELAPIATPEQCDALITHLLPDAGWPSLDWQPLHPKSAIRIFLGNAWFPSLVVIAACWRFGWIGLLALAWPAWTWFVARHHAKRAGYAVNERIVAVRAGWWSRQWRFAEIDKLQALRIASGPLDRRWGMATLWLDTAGVGAMTGPLRIAHLPEAEARALCDRLARVLAARKLRW
jgi:putative membrane protein